MFLYSVGGKKANPNEDFAPLAAWDLRQCLHRTKYTQVRFNTQVSKVPAAPWAEIRQLLRWFWSDQFWLRCQIRRASRFYEERFPVRQDSLYGIPRDERNDTHIFLAWCLHDSEAVHDRRCGGFVHELIGGITYQSLPRRSLGFLLRWPDDGRLLARSRTRARVWVCPASNKLQSCALGHDRRWRVRSLGRPAQRRPERRRAGQAHRLRHWIGRPHDLGPDSFSDARGQRRLAQLTSPTPYATLAWPMKIARHQKSHTVFC